MTPVRSASLALFIFLISLYTLSVSSSMASRNYGEGFLRISTLDSLLDHGGIEVHSMSMHWGSPGRCGMKYNWHEAGQLLFVLPLYLPSFMRDEGYAFFIVNMISASLTCVLILHILVLLGRTLRASLITALLYGAGTMAWHYASKTPHEHSLSIFFIVLSMYLALRYARGDGARFAFMCIIGFGFAAITKTDSVLAFIPIALFIHLERNTATERKLTTRNLAIISALLLAPFAAFTLGYNHIRFNSILDNGYACQTDLPLFSPVYIPMALMGYVISPGKGIFVYSPIIVLFPFFARKYLMRHPLKSTGRRFIACTFGYIALHTMFYLNFFGWDGDWCYGPRLLLPIVPFMVMPVVEAFEGWTGMCGWKRRLIVLLIAISIAYQIVSVVSCAWMANSLRYGISDDYNQLVEVRNLGKVGTWKFARSFMPVELSNPYNMIRLTCITIHHMFDSSDTLDLLNGFCRLGRIKSIDLAVFKNYPTCYETFDLWWLQHPGAVSYSIAAALAAIMLISLRFLLKSASPPPSTPKP